MMQIDRYRVLKTVREGRFGPVLLAAEPGSQTHVAVRILANVQGTQRPSLQTLKTFVQTLRQLALPGAESLLLAGELADGQPYIVSEWIAGEPLQPANLSTEVALQLGHQIVTCLCSAHGHGLTHLGLHPEDILIVPEGRRRLSSRVLGIGLVQLLGPPQTTQPQDSAAYLAPEQRTSHPGAVTAAADVYALGVLLGRLLGGPPERPLPAGVADLLLRMRAEDPTGRPALAEVSQHLSSLIAQGPRKLLSRLGRLAAQPTVNRDALTAKLDRAAAGTISAPAPAPAPAPAHEEKPLPRAAHDPLIGQQFGNFRLLRRIGSGGMGAVYEGEHQRIGHRAAVKVLHPQFASRKEFARRFLDEARAVNIVHHPGLVSIYDYGERPDGRLFIVMEFLNGEPLDVLMERCTKPLPQAAVLPLASQIARALAVAHEGGIVHRDLKPSNIMLTLDPVSQELEQIKILDFGIAKVALRSGPSDEHTEVGIAMGTPRYMAPEQRYDAGAVDGRADVFALGVLLYEMLTLKSPFGDYGAPLSTGKPPQLLHRRASVSRRLSRLVAAMLEVDPKKRPLMAKVRDELDHIARSRARLHLRLALAAGVAVMLIAGLVALRHWNREPAFGQVQARQALVRSRSSALLRSALAPENPVELRKAALLGLSEVRDPHYRPWLMPLLDDPNDELAKIAAEALAGMADEGVVAQLRKMLDHQRPQRRLIAALSLAMLKSQQDSAPGRTRLSELLELKQLAGADKRDLRIEVALRLHVTGETQYGQRVWSELEQASLDTGRRLPILERLARKEDPRALQGIRQIALQEGDPEMQLRALGILAQLGSTETDQQDRLRRSARQAGPLQLLSAWLLARVGDVESCRFLSQLVRQPKQPEDSRHLAAAGLSYCGFVDAEVMVPLIDDAAVPLPLRVHYAASLLRVIGPEPHETAAAQWQAVNGLLHSELASDRLLGISELIDIAGDESIDKLREALGDREAEVRQAAAHSLGRKRAHRALTALIPALSDANTAVRKEGLQAVLKLLQALRSQRGNSAEKSATAALHELLAAAVSKPEEILARLALLESGDTSQLQQLRRLWTEASDEQRLLIVELIDPGSELVRQALTDVSEKIRFFAARRRASIGARDAIPVLREMLRSRGEVAVMAYWLLRGLGERPSMPEQISDLLGRSYPVYTRVDVVRLLGALGDVVPAAEVLPLLQRALRDPAELVRAEVAQSAFQLYHALGELGFVDLLKALMSDPEPRVRTRATALLAALIDEKLPRQTAQPLIPREGLPPAGTPVAPLPPAARAGDGSAQSRNTAETVPDAGGQSAAAPAPAGPAKLTLTFTVPMSARLEQIDGRFQAEAVAGQQLSVPPGRYKVIHLCGSTALLLAAGEVRSQRIECSVDQLLQRAQAQRGAGRLVEASQILDVARRLARQKGGMALRDRIDFEEGDIKAARGNLPDALNSYQSVWDRKPSSQIPSIDEKFAALKSQVGRLTIRAIENGRCVTIYDQLYMPTKISIPVNGAVQSYRIVAGVQQLDEDRCKQPTSAKESRK